MMLVPEAWSETTVLPKHKRDFYEYHACLMEPWDGPALLASTDGTSVCVILDRNGLRPFRYLITKDQLLVMASEVGVLEVPPEDILHKGRIQPGRMFLVDTADGRIIDDEEIKADLAAYGAEAYGGHLLAKVDGELIGDDEFDGLHGRISQVNGLCRAADGMSLDLAAMRFTFELAAEAAKKRAMRKRMRKETSPSRKKPWSS